MFFKSLTQFREMENIQNNKITKDTYSKYLKSLFQDIDLQNTEKLSHIGLQSFKYLAENYLNLDNEMQAFADKIIDSGAELFYTALKEFPDTIEVRKSRRLLRTIKNNLASASGLIMALESKCQFDESIIIETRKLFEEYFQHFLDFLYEVSIEQSHRGQASFAKLSMMFSVVDELLAAFHMAQHGYINQAYAHTRTVSEILNLIELFIRDESYAELWFSDDEKTKMNKLKPAAVRKKIGMKDDPVYSFLSKYGSHVTKEYVQSRSLKKRKPSHNGNQQIQFSIGGTKTRGHLLWANDGCIRVLLLTFIQLFKSFPDRIHEQDYQAVVEKFAKDYIGYLRHYIELFKEAKINTEEIEAFFNNMEKSLFEQKSFKNDGIRS